MPQDSSVPPVFVLRAPLEADLFFSPQNPSGPRARRSLRGPEFPRSLKVRKADVIEDGQMGQEANTFGPNIAGAPAVRVFQLVAETRWVSPECGFRGGSRGGKEGKMGAGGKACDGLMRSHVGNLPAGREGNPTFFFRR